MFLEQVIADVAEIERSLRALGAVGRGLAELVDSVENDLPRQVQEKLRRIGGVRNRVIHQNAALTERQMEVWASEVAAVRDVLNELIGALPASVAQPPVPAAPRPVEALWQAQTPVTSFSPPVTAPFLPATPSRVSRSAVTGAAGLVAVLAASGVLSGAASGAVLNAALLGFGWTLVGSAWSTRVFWWGTAAVWGIQSWVILRGLLP